MKGIMPEFAKASQESCENNKPV